MPALFAVSRSRGGGCGDTRRLGSRLYFEFTGAALSDVAAWESLADGVAVEVRRHGVTAPAESAAAAAAAHDGSREHDTSDAALPPAILAPMPPAILALPPTPGLLAPAGVSVNIVHVDNRTTNHSNRTTTHNNSLANTNIGNNHVATSIVLL